MMQQTSKITETLAHLIVLIKSYPMNPNMTGFKEVFENRCIPELCTKVALALEGLRSIPG